MRERRLGAALVFTIVLGVTGFLPASSPPAHAGTSRLKLEGIARLASGVEHRRYSLQSPRNSIHVVRIKAGAPVTIDAVLSGNRVVGPGVRGPATSGLETTSSMCKRANALACVNGDFTACGGCTAPQGGVIRHGEVLRSPHSGWPQVWVGPKGLGAGVLGWEGRVTATYRWTEQAQQQATGVTVPGVPATEERTKSVALALSGVNVARSDGSIVLYTPTFASSTRTTAGGFEVVVTAGGRALLDRTINLRLGKAGTGGNAAIPSNGFVLSASGPAADRLRAFWQEARQHPDRLAALDLRMRTSVPVTESLGGYPVILTGGKAAVSPHSNNQATRARHPRTIVGWNPAGDVWLVTIDGRQSGRSVGASNWEQAEILRQLGATDAINVDGGGSTTFVAARCAGATLCVRNRPSDGRERPVTTALAVVPRR